MEFHHVSILLEPCLEALQIKPDGVYVDATTGGAGHSLRIAKGRDLQVRTAFCSTSAFPLRSWIMLSAVFPICRMRRSICAWTGSRS